MCRKRSQCVCDVGGAFGRQSSGFGVEADVNSRVGSAVDSGVYLKKTSFRAQKIGPGIDKLTLSHDATLPYRSWVRRNDDKRPPTSKVQ